jgi:hypothetical protein
MSLSARQFIQHEATLISSLDSRLVRLPRAKAGFIALRIWRWSWPLTVKRPKPVTVASTSRMNLGYENMNTRSATKECGKMQGGITHSWITNALLVVAQDSSHSFGLCEDQALNPNRTHNLDYGAILLNPCTLWNSRFTNDDFVEFANEDVMKE